MSDTSMRAPLAQFLPIGLTRRNLLIRSGMLGASGAMALRLAEAGAVAEGTPVAVDATRLQQLIDLSQTLAGGGTFSSDRATILYQLIAADPALTSGLDELLKTPPVSGQPLGSDQAQKTAQMILTFWFADVYDGNPLPDRGTAYYQMTSWQAMYTFSWAVCHFYGGWADAPADAPITPANSEN